MLLMRSRLCLDEVRDSWRFKADGETGDMNVMGELRVELGSGNGGACLSGVLGCKGGRPISLVGEVISDGAVLEVGVTGGEVTGVGMTTGVTGRLRVVGRTGLSISFFIHG